MTFRAFDPTAMVPALAELTGHVRGFCTNKDARSQLRRYGLNEKHVFQMGLGAESLDACVATFRGRPGWLILAQDLRAFGHTKRLVAGRCDQLEKAGIRVLDLSHPKDQTMSALMQRAQVAISGARFGHDRRRARRLGRNGGLGRARKAAEARDAACPRWLVERIVADNRIPWATKMDVLGEHFTESTLRRHYSGLALDRKA